MKGKKCRLLPVLSKLQMDVLIGSLLGDGHLHKLKTNVSNSHFAKLQTKSKKEYLDWHCDIFNEYSSGVYACFSKTKITYNGKKIVHKEQTKKLTSYAYRTFNNEVITQLRNKWYPKGIKKIPSDLELNPQKIAIWYFDDGSNDAKRRVITICTNSFTAKEVKFLSRLLNAFDLFPTIVVRKSRDGKKKQPMLKFHGDSYDKLISLISPHMLWDCFAYKIKWRAAKKTWIRNAKITESDAKEIIKLRQTESTKTVAKKYNLHVNTINDIVAGRKWKNLAR